MKRSKLWGQIAALVLVAAVFAAFNGGMYVAVTRRLANNFSSAAGGKMIEVEQYLPFDAQSRIYRCDTASLKLEGDLPVLDGASALLPVYAAIAHAVYPPDSVCFDGENYTPESAVQYRNTVRGYRAIVDGTADLLFCAAPSAEQMAYAAERQVELVYLPIGYEAFVFFVNENNPVDSLTQDEIRGIYAGEYRNWAELGGANRIINPLTRLAGSGSQSAMDAFMGETAIGPKSPLALCGGSIGFSFRYYLDGLVGNRAVKMLSVDGVYPSADHIKNGTYPIIMPFYAIYRADDDNPNLPLLLDWILSDEGQALINGSGYVGIG